MPTPEPTPTPDPYPPFTKSHQIIGSPDGAQTNYQVKIVVHKGTGTDSGHDVFLNDRLLYWPNDIYFTNGAGSRLSHWTEYADASIAVVWIKVDSIPAAPGTATMVLHGNYMESDDSNIQRTMIFGDDFNAYSGWSTYQYGTTGSAGVSNGEMRITCGAGGAPSTEGIKRSTGYESGHTAWGAKMYTVGSEAHFYTLNYNPDRDPWHYPSWYRVSAKNDSVNFERNTDGSKPELFVDTGAKNSDYHIYEICYDGTRVRYFMDGAQKYNEDARIGGTLYMTLENTHADTPTTTCVDYVYIRNYTPNEPTHGAWTG